MGKITLRMLKSYFWACTLINKYRGEPIGNPSANHILKFFEGCDVSSLIMTRLAEANDKITELKTQMRAQNRTVRRLKRKNERAKIELQQFKSLTADMISKYETQLWAFENADKTLATMSMFSLKEHTVAKIKELEKRTADYVSIPF